MSNFKILAFCHNALASEDRRFEVCVHHSFLHVMSTELKCSNELCKHNSKICSMPLHMPRKRSLVTQQVDCCLFICSIFGAMDPEGLLTCAIIICPMVLQSKLSEIPSTVICVTFRKTSDLWSFTCLCSENYVTEIKTRCMNGSSSACLVKVQCQVLNR